MLAAIATSLRLVRTTGRGAPWLLLVAVLVVMSTRRVMALWRADAAPPDLPQEATSLVIAVLMLLAVRAQARFIDDVGRLRTDRATTLAAHETLLAQMPMVALVVESAGAVRFLNPAELQRVTGYDPDQTQNLEFWLSRVHDDDRRETAASV